MSEPVKINPCCGQCYFSEPHDGVWFCRMAYEVEDSNIREMFTANHQRSMDGYCKPWGNYFMTEEAGRAIDESAAQAWLNGREPLGEEG